MKKVLKATGMLFLLMLFPFLLGYFIIRPNSTSHSDRNFSKTEQQLILKGSNNDPMRLLNYFDTIDSVKLRTQSIDIQIFNDKDLTILIKRLMATVTNPMNTGIGIAAPQVGINKRVIIVQRFDKENQPYEVYINPYIVSYSDTYNLRPDACLSIPNVKGYSYRADWIEIYYYTTDGQKHVEIITDPLTAHIFQHEIDHLDGIVFLDRMRLKE